MALTVDHYYRIGGLAQQANIRFPATHLIWFWALEEPVLPCHPKHNALK
jgi:hypothetical protein